jgi:hypothetical protein
MNGDGVVLDVMGVVWEFSSSIYLLLELRHVPSSYVAAVCPSVIADCVAMAPSNFITC